MLLVGLYVKAVTMMDVVLACQVQAVFEAIQQLCTDAASRPARITVTVACMPCIYIYKIAQSVFVCYLSPPKLPDMQRPKLACRRVPTLGRTFVVFYVDRGHRWEEN